MASPAKNISHHQPKLFSEARTFEVFADGVMVGYGNGSARFFERVRDDRPDNQARPPEQEDQVPSL